MKPSTHHSPVSKAVPIAAQGVPITRENSHGSPRSPFVVGSSDSTGETSNNQISSSGGRFNGLSTSFRQQEKLSPIIEARSKEQRERDITSRARERALIKRTSLSDISRPETSFLTRELSSSNAAMTRRDTGKFRPGSPPNRDKLSTFIGKFGNNHKINPYITFYSRVKIFNI
jgi:hypothetical protein